MNDNFSEIMRYFLQDRIPLVTSALLIILFCMPIDFMEISGLRPQIGLICVYYWVEKRPLIFGFISAFLLGLLMDICNTTPLGIDSLLLMIFTFFLGKIYHYIRPASFGVDWFFFALAALIYMLLKWCVFVLYFGQFIEISSLLVNVFSTLTFYPLIAYVNNWIRLHLLVQERINE